MPVPPIRTDNWAKGANNIARPERLPEGFSRELVNLDPTEGGQLELRADYERVAGNGDMRSAVALSGRVVCVDGAEVGCYLAETDSWQTLGEISSAGEVAGVALNGQVFLSTVSDSLRTDGRTLKAWAVSAPLFSAEIISGSLPAGIYKVAVTALGADGEESGAEPLILRLTDGQAIRIVSADERNQRAYCSAANGAALFSQGPLIGGGMAVTQVDDQRDRLTTSGLVPMPHCSQLAAFRSVLVGITDRYVVFTSPMYPHLMDPVAGFFQYPEPPSVIAPTEGGVYVVADRTYFITALESGQPTQVAVLDLKAVPGSAVRLPDGRAAWFTRYGQAIGSPAGEVQLPNRTTYAPELAAQGAAGVVENNGIPMVVTTMRGAAQHNNLGVGDWADLEIVEIGQ